VVTFDKAIEELRNTNFKVKKIAVGMLKDLKKLCKENYGDIYWVGISELLKTKKKYDEIFILISSLQKQIDILNSKLNGGEEKILKTFGDE